MQQHEALCELCVGVGAANVLSMDVGQIDFAHIGRIFWERKAMRSEQFTIALRTVCDSSG